MTRQRMVLLAALTWAALCSGCNIPYDPHPPAPPTTRPAVNGCLARYAIVDARGTTVPDTCPDTASAPNNATLQLPGPVIGSFGALYLPDNGAVQRITTPLKSWKTAVVSYCVWPRGGNDSLTLTTTGGNGYFYVAEPIASLWAAGSSDGVRILPNQAFLATGQAGTYGIAANSVARMAGFFGQCHVLAVALDSTDTFYMDGALQSTSAAAANAAAARSETTYTLGGTTDSEPYTGFRGWINYFEAYPGVLTAAQVQQESERIAAVVQARAGFPQWPQYDTASRTDTVLCVGSSLTAGVPSTVPWCAAPYLAPAHPYQLLQYGIAAQSSVDIAALFPSQEAGGLAPHARTIVMSEGGTNDLQVGMTVDQTLAAMASIAAQSAKAGALTTQATVMSRASGVDTARDPLNATLVANWRQMGLAAIVDLAELPALGAHGAYANTACFVDGTHLTGPGSGSCANGHSGYSLLAQAYTDTLNYLDGSTPDHPAAASTYPYTMTFSTPAVRATGCKDNNCTLVLPACDHMDDMPFQVTNAGHAFSVSVVPPASSFYQATPYSLNSASLPVAVAPGATVIFTESRGSVASGGCQWITQETTTPATR